MRFYLDKIQSEPRFFEEALSALIAADRLAGATLFRQGTVLTRLEAPTGGHTTLQPLTEERLGHELEKHVIFYKAVVRLGERGEKMIHLVEATTPPRVPRAILARTDNPASPDLSFPLLTRIMTAPFFAADGTFVVTPGYHAASRTYYAPCGPLVLPAPVPDAPDDAELRQALVLLFAELLADFPFTTDADRAHTAALMLAPFVRALYRGPSPGHLIEKPDAGTGATLLTQIALWPFLGEQVIPFPETDNEEEWRKRIIAGLAAGPAVMFLDNLAHMIGSPALATVLTTTTLQDRILGFSQIMRVENEATWVMTANNPTYTREIMRRLIRVRIDAMVERPEERTGFRHVLPDWARDHRGELAWALAVLVKRWLAEGRPTTGVPVLGMFVDFSPTVGGILRTAGIPGFLENREAMVADDPEESAWRDFAQRWSVNFGNREVRTGALRLLLTGDIPISLGGGDEHSQQTTLGMKLARRRGKVVTIRGASGPTPVRILRGAEDGLWRLEVSPSRGATLSPLPPPLPPRRRVAAE